MGRVELSGAEDARLLPGELLVGEDARLVQLPELLELGEHVVRRALRGGRRWRRRRVDLLGWRGLGCGLVGPAVVLTPRDAVGHHSRGTGDSSGTCDATNEPWHGGSPVPWGWSVVELGVERRENGLDGDPAGGHQLPSCPAHRCSERRCPHVLVQQQSGGAGCLERDRRLRDVVVIEKPRADPFEDRQVHTLLAEVMEAETHDGPVEILADEHHVEQACELVIVDTFRRGVGRRWRSGQRLGLDRVELSRRDRPGVEKLLRLRHLLCRRRRRALRHRPDVLGLCLLVLLSLLGRALCHPAATGDQVDERPEHGQQDQEHAPQRLAPATELVVAEDVREDREQHHEVGEEDE